MITGTITLNNLDDSEVALILEARSAHVGVLEIRIPMIDHGNVASHNLISGVQIGWETEEGFRVAIDAASRLFNAGQPVAKTA